MKKQFLFYFIIVLMFIACSDDKSTSNYPVNFSCDISLPPYNIVQGFGEYITITSKKGGAAYTINYREGSIDKDMTVDLSAWQLQQGAFSYGLGGLIIGTPSALSEPEICAFDLACPKCDLVRCKLTIIHPEEHAYCEKCGSKYSLNDGGIPIEGDTRTLWRYRVVQNLPYIYVIN